MGVSQGSFTLNWEKPCHEIPILNWVLVVTWDQFFGDCPPQGEPAKVKTDSLQTESFEILVQTCQVGLD